MDILEECEMEYMTLKEAGEKWGVSARHSWPYSRRCENGNTMVNSQRCQKAGGWQDKAREGFET